MESLILKKGTLLIAILFTLLPKAQPQKLKDNWQNLDLKTDSVFGISTEKAYTELLKGKKHVTVLVAVIDDGVDINHEDLRPVIWTNPKEIASNHIDDDQNGYVDDIHGWNFIGGAKENVEYENYEFVRIVRSEKPRYENADTTTLSPAEKLTYHDYLGMKARMEMSIKYYQTRIKDFSKEDMIIDTLLTDMNIKNPTPSDFKKYQPKNAKQKAIVNYIIAHDTLNDFETFRKQRGVAYKKNLNAALDYTLNINYDMSKIIGDNPSDDNERFYGNNDVIGSDANHGTHVSGIIAAVRNNNLGIKGVADDVMIMPVRMNTPEGDERDKDVANAIRYAADNGAKVINMSFGKNYSWDKKVVDDAVKYAVSKDVLIVHCAGNDNTDCDKTLFYPNRMYGDGSGLASTWIEVGASDSKDDQKLRAGFSNYGEKTVDVFAPGVDIYSTTPNSTYEDDSGTSMASPAVAGLGALIRSYYPKLTALQVKEIILQTVVKVNHDVLVHGQSIPFAQVCKTGGIVNAYNALKLAATY
jgi:subtilisin family serine protease